MYTLLDYWPQPHTSYAFDPCLPLFKSVDALAYTTEMTRESTDLCSELYLENAGLLVRLQQSLVHGRNTVQLYIE